MDGGDAGIDHDRLQAALSTVLDGRVVDTQVVHEGLNTTITVATETADPAYVLRKPDGLRDTALFNDIGREYRILERLADTHLPTPEPVAFCGDASLLGEPFLVTTHLAGREVPMGERLEDRFPTADARRQFAHRLVDTLAEIHTLDVGRVDGVCDHQPPLYQVDRAVERLDGATAVTGREVPELRRVVDWLHDHPPADGPTALMHGDFKPGNLLVAGGADPAVTAVLDWEAAALGDPRTELGYLLLYWRDADDPTRSLRELEETHGSEAVAEVRAIDREGFYPFTTLAGSPTRRALVERWEDRSGLRFDDDRFFRAHGALMLATVWEDLHRHAVEAGEPSDYPGLADYVARVAGEIVDGQVAL